MATKENESSASGGVTKEARHGAERVLFSVPLVGFLSAFDIFDHTQVRKIKRRRSREFERLSWHSREREAC